MLYFEPPKVFLLKSYQGKNLIDIPWKPEPFGFDTFSSKMDPTVLSTYGHTLETRCAMHNLSSSIERKLNQIRK